MTLLPSYPILCGALFICLGIFYSFQSAREQGDLLYTLLLPLGRRDVVFSKYLFACFYHALSWVLMLLFMLLRLLVLDYLPAYYNNVMMPANPAFLGFTLLIYAAFNVLFLNGFFRTARTIGRPFLYFLVAALALMALGEGLHHVPALSLLGQTGTEALVFQILVCAVSLAVYLLATLWSFRDSVRRFEMLEL